ncbi:MAG: hypothetical protein E7033_06210 [Akkermansiaceae bacterium]|nr:hypothetical protein [Akkermansiaceae bacterium]
MVVCRPVLMHFSSIHTTYCHLFVAATLLGTAFAAQVPDDKSLNKMIERGGSKLAVMEETYGIIHKDKEQADYARALKKDIDEEKRRYKRFLSDAKNLAAEVKKSGKINKQDKEGRTLLMLVAAIGNDAATEMVLAAEPDITLADKNGRTAFHYEAQSGGRAIYNLLNDLWCNTFLTGDADAIQELLDCGANPDWPVQGQLPLAIAIANKHNALFDILLFSGAQVGNRLADGSGYIDLAVHYNNSDALNGLLNKVQSVDIRLHNAAPLFWHLLDAEHAECLMVWFNRAKELNQIQTADGASRFCLIMRQAAEESAMALATHNKNLLQTEDAQGNLPLHEAARRGSTRLYHHLINSGADTNQRNTRGETTLMHAVLSGNQELLAEVLKGISAEHLNAKDTNGRTAHYYAKLSQNTAAADMLRAAGLAPQQKD